MDEQLQGNFLSKRLVVALGAMISCALWGSAFPFVKIGYALWQIPASDSWTQVLFAGCRFIIAGLLVILIGSILEHRVLLPRRQALPVICKISLFQTVLQYVFFYIGLAHTTGVKGAIIIGSNVFFAILISCLIFRHEKLTARKIIGCLIGFSGIVLVNMSGSALDLNISFLGDGFVLLSTIAYSYAAGLMKRHAQAEDPVLLSGYQFLLGGAAMVLISLLGGGRLTAPSWASAGVLLYLGFLSAAAYTIWSLLLKFNPVSQVSVYGFMNPMFGTIFSTLILREEGLFRPATALALALVCLGIWIVNRVPAQAEVPASQGPPSKP